LLPLFLWFCYITQYVCYLVSGEVSSEVYHEASVDVPNDVGFCYSYDVSDESVFFFSFLSEPFFTTVKQKPVCFLLHEAKKDVSSWDTGAWKSNPRSCPNDIGSV
jgi:hypothetical protein